MALNSYNKIKLVSSRTVGQLISIPIGHNLKVSPCHSRDNQHKNFRHLSSNSNGDN